MSSLYRRCSVCMFHAARCPVSANAVIMVDKCLALLTGLLLVKAELLPVLPLKLFQLTENTVLLLLGQGLPAGLNVGDDVAKLDLVGALDEGACVACGLESPSLFLGDQGSSAKEGSRAETASGSASNVLADHDSKVMRMNDTQKYEEMRRGMVMVMVFSNVEAWRTTDRQL